MKLEGMFFDTSTALSAEVEEILADISIAEWVKVFDKWKDHLKRYIDTEGQTDLIRFAFLAGSWLFRGIF
jgi:hypothetical protein